MNSSRLNRRKRALSEQGQQQLERLNCQHNLGLRVSNGHLIHPSIPLSQIRNVADIGTGTGIWLEQLHSQLSDNSAPPQRFDGFDISPSLFPKKGKCKYTIQNMLNPFPVEYHELYDLVHVRYTVVEFRKEHYVSAVDNLMTLLKPGGYLQWEDLDYSSIITTMPSPVHTELHTLTGNLFLSLGISLSCSDEIHSAFKAVGLQNIIREERNSYWDKTLNEDCQKWFKENIGSVITDCLMWSGQMSDKEEAEALSKEKMQGLEEEQKEGAVPNFPHRVVIGRKGQ